MKVKKEYVILGVIIVVLVGYLVFQDSNHSRQALPELPKVTEKEITGIEIKSSTGNISLARKGDDWVMGENAWLADKSKVTPILTAITELRLIALVSTAKAYERYDLTDEKKITVIAQAGDREVRRFDIGKAADTFQQTFMMIPNDPNVYHALKNIRRTFETKADALRNMKVLAVPVETIKEIRLAGAGKTASYTRHEVPEPERKENPGEAQKPEEKKAQTEKPVITWQDAAGKTLDNDTVKRLLAKFSGLSCESYINEKKKEEFANPVYGVTLMSEKTYALSIFDKKEGDEGYPAVSSENDYPFILSTGFVDGMKKEIDGLMGPK